MKRSGLNPVICSLAAILFTLLSALLPALLLAACETPSGSRIDRSEDIEVPGGDVEQGRQLLKSWGCGSCHNIPGITGADGLVGPPLDAWAERQYIAGSLPNTPDNLIRWIVNPQEIEPGTAMPNLDVQEDSARHMSAYLFTLHEIE